MTPRPLSALGWAALLLALGVALFPIYWVAMTSIKPPAEWSVSPALWTAQAPTLDNYRVLFDPAAVQGKGLGGVSASATRAVVGSLVASVSATLLSVALGLAAAIGIVRYAGGGSPRAALNILSGRMFPPAAIAVPFVVVFASAGLIDSYAGLVLVYVAVTLPFSTWMLKSFVEEVPREVEEAAMLDGHSRIMAQVLVTLPLIRGGLLATTLFVFILNWSEFLLAMVLSYTRVITIPVQLAKYVTATAGTLFGVQAALAVLAAAPLVLAGYAIQGHLVRGMTFGAVKR